jgi:hypothetical protein
MRNEGLAKSAPKKKARISRIAVPREVQCAPGVRPDDQPHFEQDDSEFRRKPPSEESPFEKYRGIGNPATPLRP